MKIKPKFKKKKKTRMTMKKIIKKCLQNVNFKLLKFINLFLDEDETICFKI